MNNKYTDLENVPLSKQIEMWQEILNSPENIKLRKEYEEQRKKAKEEQERQERRQFIIEQVAVFVVSAFAVLFIALLFSTI